MEIFREYLGLLVAGAGLVLILIGKFSNALGITHGTAGTKHTVILVVGLALLAGGLIAYAVERYRYGPRG